MDARLSLPLGAALLFVASGARAADPAEAELLRSLVFVELDAPGPRRDAVACDPAAVDAQRPAAEVLDWVSPLFLWIEPGYGFAELTLTI